MEDLRSLKDRIRAHDCPVGVVGLGYVGLPLVLRFGEVGFRVIGFDVDLTKVKQLNEGSSYIQHIASDPIDALLRMSRFEATTQLDRLDEPDALIMCVPTPLTR